MTRTAEATLKNAARAWVQDEENDDKLEALFRAAESFADARAIAEFVPLQLDEIIEEEPCD